MARYGAQYGPDITFLGGWVCRDWADAATYVDADVVILGAPFEGGTSYRSGTRFGSGHLQSCYLEHDGSRPSLALRVDALRDLRVYDAGDVEMFSEQHAPSPICRRPSTLLTWSRSPSRWCWWRSPSPGRTLLAWRSTSAMVECP